MQGERERRSPQSSGERCAEREPVADDPSEFRYLNRELSWIDFNLRVLALAEDESRPLLERVKFLAIYSENFDQFFQVRVAGLKAQQESGLSVSSPDGATPTEQLRAIRARVKEGVERRDAIFLKKVAPELEAAGIRLRDWGDLGEAERSYLTDQFEERIFPVLTPLSVDPAHPFPYISNLSLSLAIVVRDPDSGTHRFARLKVPPLLPRFLALPNDSGFIPVEQVIANHLYTLFPGMEVVSHFPFRVTRDADLAIEEDEGDDLLVAIESGLRRRHRSNAGVRLEVAQSMSPEVRDILADELELEPDDVYVVEAPLGMRDFWFLYDLDRPDLKHEPVVPFTQARLGSGKDPSPDIFDVLAKGDILVQHPYDAFRTSVEAFLARAAADPNVLAIKHTLYRTSGSEDNVVRTLTRAAESGKQVVAVVELQARFDEEANIEWARTLEKAGVHVVYGLVGLKTHAKVTLVVRLTRGGIQRFCHVGTGNYNPETARSYEDIGLLSSSPELGADLTELFNHLTGYSREKTYRKLLVAPVTFRSSLVELIRREMDAPDGRIILKVNSLADPEIIEALYEASQAGVEIDLIVRGICCLRPGVPGLSERIRVRSIVGRFLEHSRLFRFGSEARGQRYFIGSADLLTRNLDRRVEVVTPVEVPRLKERLAEILTVYLTDEVLAWELAGDGRWRQVRGAGEGESHVRLLQLARERSREPEGSGDDRPR